MEVTLVDVANQVAAIAEKLEKLDGVEGRLTGHVDRQSEGIEGRLTGHIDRQFEGIDGRLTGHIDRQFEGIEGRLTGHIDRQFEGIEGRLTGHIDKQLSAAVAELKHQATLHKEELRDDVKKAAEGYDATLRKIERELLELNQKVDNGFRDHAVILKDHGARITTLEKRR